MTESNAAGERMTAMACRTAVGVMTVGCVALLVALMLPPPGEIDNSVLIAFGEMSTFAGTIFGIKKHTDKNQDEKDR